MRRESRAERTSRARRILDRLSRAHPDAGCTLDHRSPLELLVATVLSAQSTDERVNRTTPRLFARFGRAADYAASPPGEIEELIRSLGFYNSKARALRGIGRALVERHGGGVPASMEELVRLPGVGRKTANVVLGNAFGRPEGAVVDTHVGRLARRMGLTSETDPVKIEQALTSFYPSGDLVRLGHTFILHGRQTCQARKPACQACPVLDLCPRIGVMFRAPKPRID